jgi:hypothetical protein
MYDEMKRNREEVGGTEESHKIHKSGESVLWLGFKAVTTLMQV